jgi:CDGSH-type Zn-finger protein/uncharacterized Fe-S cluster protein YjdI
MSDKTKFGGEEIDVEWDGRLCIHIGECGRSTGDLFVGGRNPWCVPDISTKAEVREIVERCPSGALSYHDKDGEQETAAEENTITVAYHGPLYASGKLEIWGRPDDMPGVEYRATLCRCGKSANKPFCDNSHIKSRFDDNAAVGDKGTTLESIGGKLDIKPLPDGPLLIKGNLTIRAGDARVAWQGTETALCRCGASNNKPFCDGSHKKAGFKG